MTNPQSPETPARGSLDRMHAQIKSGDYLAAQTHALAAIAEALVQMVEPAPIVTSARKNDYDCTCLADKTVSNYCGLHGDPTNPGGDCK